MVYNIRGRFNRIEDEQSELEISLEFDFGLEKRSWKLTKPNSSKLFTVTLF